MRNNVDFLLKIYFPSSINLTKSANIAHFLKLDESRAPTHFEHQKLITLDDCLGVYNFSCHKNQSFDFSYYSPIPFTIKSMIFKTPGERTTMFTSLLLSAKMQQALHCHSLERGCTFVPLPESLNSLGDLIGVIWPVANTPEGVIFLSPHSSLGASHERLQTLSTIGCMLHAEQVKIISNKECSQIKTDTFVLTSKVILHISTYLQQK